VRDVEGKRVRAIKWVGAVTTAAAYCFSVASEQTSRVESSTSQSQHVSRRARPQ